MRLAYGEAAELGRSLHWAKNAAWGYAGGSERPVPWSCMSEPSRPWGCVFIYKPFMAEFALIAAGREMAWREKWLWCKDEWWGLWQIRELRITQVWGGAEGAVHAQLQLITALRTHGWTRVCQIFKFFFFFSEKSCVWNFGVISILKKKIKPLTLVKQNKIPDNRRWVCALKTLTVSPC